MSRPRLTWQSTGAQVLTAEVGGWPLLYCSPLHDPGSRRPARGGVPVLFPQFADRGPHKKHGWARDVEWSLVDEQITDGAHWAHWQLELGKDAHPDWPYLARLDLSAKASTDALWFELQITNTGSNAFNWTGGLHPYWAVSDVRKCTITGLTGTVVQDRFNPGKKVEACDRVQPTGNAFESLYDTPAPIELTSDHRTLRLSMTGFDQWMIWNPGEMEARHMADIPSGGWQAFICIEPVRASRPYLLEPGDTFVGTLRAHWVTDTRPPSHL